jgi:hypothetical protein
MTSDKYTESALLVEGLRPTRISISCEVLRCFSSCCCQGGSVCLALWFEVPFNDKQDAEAVSREL